MYAHAFAAGCGWFAIAEATPLATPPQESIERVFVLDYKGGPPVVGLEAQVLLGVPSG